MRLSSDKGKKRERTTAFRNEKLGGGIDKEMAGI